METETKDTQPEEIFDPAEEAKLVISRFPLFLVGLSVEKELELRAALALKLSSAYASISSVLHDDRNQDHNYSFASAETIYRTVRDGLSKTKLAVIPFMSTFFETPIYKRDNSGERRGAYLVVDYDFLLMDAETGYSIPIPWKGEVMEYGDKAFNKASTNATKYFLRTLFLIPADKSEDPDAVSEQGDRPERSRGRGTQNRRNRNQEEEDRGSDQGGGNDGGGKPPAPEKLTPEQERAKKVTALYSLVFPGLKVPEGFEGGKVAYEKTEEFKRSKLNASAFRNVCKEHGFAWEDIILEIGAAGETSEEALSKLVQSKIDAKDAEEDARAEKRFIEEILKEYNEHEGKDAFDTQIDLIKKGTVEELVAAAVKTGVQSFMDFATYLDEELQKAGGA